MTSVIPADGKTTGPIAYLSGEYPKVSHTFILREIEALRQQGIEVLSCTVRRAHDRDVVGADQKAEAARTFGVIETAKAPHHLIGAHLSMFLQSPKRWFSALALAFATRPPGVKALLWQLFYFIEAAVLAQYLQRNGVRHLHNHFANSSCSVAMLTSEMSGIPFSFTLHGPAIFFEPEWWRLDEKIARAEFVSCISHFARSQAMLFSDQMHWDKLKIVHCGIDPNTYRRAPEATRQNIVFVGRLAAVKGAPLLLRAFAAIAARFPEARLRVIGDGPDRAALQAEATALGIAARVDFLGYQPQDAVAAELARSDMLVLPSFAEGVPVVLMEAMASRLPVIASRVAGIAELVEDGVSGFLIPPGDLETLTDRLETLLSDPDLCSRMGTAGRSKVEVEFNGAKEAAWLARLFTGSGKGTLPSDTHNIYSIQTSEM